MDYQNQYKALSSSDICLVIQRNEMGVYQKAIAAKESLEDAKKYNEYQEYNDTDPGCDEGRNAK